MKLEDLNTGFARALENREDLDVVIWTAVGGCPCQLLVKVVRAQGEESRLPSFGPAVHLQGPRA